MERPDIDRLLAEDAWLRRLAARLAGSSGAADDVVQETWVAALAAPREPENARAWLAGVARNAWRGMARGGARRTDRERAAHALHAQRGDVAGTGEVAQELALRRALLDHLLVLDEPLREAVFLRYYRDASLAELARRQGVSVSTAQARVSSGLARLRERLDREHGGERTAWIAALAALARDPEAASAAPGAGPLILGGTAMSTAVKLTLAAAAAAALVAVALRSGADVSPEVAPSARAAAPAPTGLDRAQVAPVSAAPAGGARERSPVATAPSSAAAASAVAPVSARGRVVDVEGRPVAGARVRFSLGRTEGFVESGPGGAFEVRAPLAASEEPPDGSGVAGAGTPEGAAEPSGGERPEGETQRPVRLLAVGAVDVRLADERWFQIAADGEGDARRLVAAARNRYAGVVKDPRGVGLAGAEVEALVHHDVYRRLGVVHDYESPGRYWANTAADGSFELAAPGGIALLVARHPGYADGRLELPAADDLGLALELAREGDELLLRGVVLEASGAPAVGAKISAGDAITTADGDGRFELRWSPSWRERAELEVGADGVAHLRRDPSLIVAVQPGSLPARAALDAETAERELVLVLGGPALELEGRVVDLAGEPVEGALVWLHDPTPFGALHVGEADLRFRAPVTLEEELGGPRVAETDARGGFRLTRLDDREYLVAAADPRSLVLGEVAAARPGRGAPELVLPLGRGVARVAGRVLDGRGEPLAGVSVQRAWSRGTGPERGGPPRAEDQVFTDGEGRFDLGELALAGAELQLCAPSLPVCERVKLADERDPGALEVRLARSCELQVVVRDPALADQVALLDGEGRAVLALEVRGNVAFQTPRPDLVDGRTSVLQVGETACTLVLYREHREVLRRPLELSVAERTTVDL